MRARGLLACLVFTVACSDGGSSPVPSAPTPPPALSPPLQPANLQAVLTNNMDLPKFDPKEG